MTFGAGDIATSGVQDAVDARDLPLEGVHEARGVSSHGADEHPGPVLGLLLRIDDLPCTLDAQADGFFYHDMLARLERRDAVHGVVFIRRQDEDEVDVRIVDELVGVHAAPGHVESGLTEVYRLLGSIADGCDFEIFVQQLQRREMDLLGDFPGANDSDT